MSYPRRPRRNYALSQAKFDMQKSGYDAGVSGKPLSACPYTDDLDYSRWRTGWIAGDAVRKIRKENENV